MFKSSGSLGLCGGTLLALAAAACVSANAADKKLFGVSWQHFNEERPVARWRTYPNRSERLLRPAHGRRAGIFRSTELCGR